MNQQIYVKQGKYELARQSLEQALSADFVVRETVAYHVLQAQILVKSLQFEEALKVPSKLSTEICSRPHSNRF